VRILLGLPILYLAALCAAARCLRLALALRRIAHIVAGKVEKPLGPRA
jgi:hypothetical protein